MKRKFDLSETDIKAAIAAYILNTTGVDIDSEDIILNVQKRTDSFDRESYGYNVTATASERGGA